MNPQTKVTSNMCWFFFCLNRKVRTYSEGSYSQVMSNDTISSSCTTFGCCYLILVSMLWLLLYLNVVLNSTIECNTKCAIPALSVLLKYCVFLLPFFHLIPYFHSFLSSYLFSQCRGNHWHPRGWPVVCHHAKINANSLSLSGTRRGEPFHLFIIIVCHLLLAQPDDEPSLLFICCPQDVACPWRGCSFFSLHFQYLIYFQYSQKGGTAGLEGTLTDSQDEKIKKWHWRKLYPVFQFFPS